MTDAMDNEPDSLLAGEYVLGTLSEDDRKAVTERLRTDSDLAEQVTYWENRLAPLSDAVAPITPPDRVWQRISDSLPGDTVDRARENEPTLLQSWWRNLPLWRGLTAAGFAMALMLGVALFFQQQPSYMVVLATPDGHSPGWIVKADNRSSVQLQALGSFEVPQGKALEFWTKADDWDGPVSLGLVKPGQTMTIPLDQLPPLEGNQLFEITLENETGSPTGKPTGPIQHIGRSVPL